MATTHDKELLREVKLLRQQVHELHVAHIRSRSIRHGWLGHVLHDLEYNPRTQYRVHITAAYVWIANLLVVLALQALFPEFWNTIAVLYVAVVSLYANFATDYGAASAALAAMGQAPLPELPTEPA